MGTRFRSRRTPKKGLNCLGLMSYLGLDLRHKPWTVNFGVHVDYVSMGLHNTEPIIDARSSQHAHILPADEGHKRENS